MLPVLISATLALTHSLDAEILLTEGLAIRGVSQRGPSPTPADHLLAALEANGWQSPRAGEGLMGMDGKLKVWSPIRASQDGTFDRRAYASGWVHIAVDRRKAEIMLLSAPGCGMVYVDGVPHAGDFGFYGGNAFPIRLRAGKTSLFFAVGRTPLRAKLMRPRARFFLDLGDATLPDAVVGPGRKVWAGILVVNATESWARDLRIRASTGNGNAVETALPAIAPLSYRKVPVQLEVPASIAAGELRAQLTIEQKGRTVDTGTTALRVRTPLQTRKITFRSSIDGSVQYYAVNPAQAPGDGKPLVLAMHGARTEAIEMADDYRGKDWCNIVCPTNRRPFGFDWEDIGRLDALEVLDLAKSELSSDPTRTYLTGHSMGGHGCWINGLMFPDRWAAIAPCAAWISISGYWGRIEPTNSAEQAFFQASNASETLMMLANAMHFPIYIHHGDKDEDVEFSESLKMKADLERIGHPAVQFHAMPGGGHWFGTESIDWPGIFDHFRDKRLVQSAEKSEVDFSTVNLAASSKAWWVEVLQQEKAMAVSRVRLKRGKDATAGTTENVAAVRLEPGAFAPGSARVQLDGQEVQVSPGGAAVTLTKTEGKWRVVPGIAKEQKRPEQMGPLREVFRNGFIFVYGTKGRSEESASNLALARFQAEIFAVGGNGSASILSDRELLRQLDEESKRRYIRKPDVPNVILFGSEDTNSAWTRLLKECPIGVRRGTVTTGKKVFRGNDLACLFVRPRAGDDRALVGVLASTGPRGQRLLERLPYFVSGAHFPDWSVMSADVLEQGIQGVRAAGFFGNDWELVRTGNRLRLP